MYNDVQLETETLDHRDREWAVRTDTVLSHAGPQPVTAFRVGQTSRPGKRKEL